MENRWIVSVATGRYTVGLDRLERIVKAREPQVRMLTFRDRLPVGSPTHAQVPYAFKAYALQEALQKGAGAVLWLDASIVPIRPLEPLWEQIERDGYWFSENYCWDNGQWCSEAALPLFGMTRQEAHAQKHVVGGAFGLDLQSEPGTRFLAEYLRFAQNGAFCGSWQDHRHDQTAASVIAHRLGFKLTIPPAPFCYRKEETDETILVADGSY